ncbi:MAG: EscU/YscU/HrcU family type III secretion system export apparatus switch protein [Christensenellales bacterium]|jgi:flagellar biosynthesis protein
MKDPHNKKEEPLHAAALKYDATQDDAPRVVAIGQGLLAQNILREAEVHDVAVLQDEALSSALRKLGLGDDIPQELYQAVAQVMVFVSRLDGSRRQRFGLNDAGSIEE